VREAVLTMGRIFVRGTRDLPKVYADYFDVDGTRRTRLLRGVRTKSEGKEALGDGSAIRNPSPLLHAVLALALLVVALVLAIHKPRGLTLYGWRKKNSHPHGGGQPDESHRTERNPGPVAGL
jgi:hypothetical protein